ncbi:ABC transporter ATP-binding protein [Phytohabitans aurantiacus]|jgi:putative ABC transport system ATP-binding protein|uniref:Macrolide ABC transporter ATP-binding protein n=1 Tax=Phytohabitans aurantiacus TaxID=3016789 RepID=A0ABQ5QN70_9ACTN|nr:ABC transporter ATP-binding protein [Phytohabitans aurantiacus]GLH95407.1 macrolide ABC transporter ATP-binding protein [Phytohabitans aurantiacus]
MSLLSLRGISRTYDDGQPVYALRPTTLDIAAGEYVSVTGPSGSGKSTFLNVLGLLDEPTTGSYRVGSVETVGGGQLLHGAVRGQLFGFVFQAFHLLSGRTALENVEIGMLYGSPRRRQRRRLAVEALERIGLAHRTHADPRQLSGGERQRVAIARAIAGRPSVLFCDEPTGNLDSGNTANVMSLLRELNDQGLTLVVVTHDPDVAAHAGRRLRVEDGEVSER